MLFEESEGKFFDSIVFLDWKFVGIVELSMDSLTPG